MSAGGVKAGEAFVEVGLKTGKIQAGLRKLETRLSSFANKTKALSATMFKVGAAITIPLGLAAKEFAKFSDQVAFVGTVVKDKSKLPELAKLMRDASITYGRSTAEMSTSLHALLSDSIPVEKAFEALNAAATLAAGGQAETTAATSAMLTVYDQFRGGIKSTTDATDFLAKTAQLGRTDLGKLAGGIGRVASRAAGAGIKVNEFGALIASLTKGTASTELAFTSLGGIITAFTVPSEGAKKALQQLKDEGHKLSFSLDAASLKSVGILNIFKQLEGLDPDTMAKLFPAAEAQTGTVPLLKNINEALGFQAQIQDRAGAAAADFAERLKTLGFALARTTQVMRGFRSAVGKAIDAPLKVIIGVFNTAVTAATKFVQNNKGVVQVLLGVGIAALTAASALLITSIAAVGLSKIFSILRVAIGIIPPVLLAIKMGFAFLISPMGLVVIAIAGIIAAFLAFTQTGNDVVAFISDAFSGLVKNISESMDAIFTALSRGDIAAAAQVLFASLNVIWVSGTIQLEAVWNAYVDRFIITGLSLKKSWVNVTSDMASIWTNIVDGFKSTWEDATNYIAKGWIDLLGVFDKNLDTNQAKEFQQAESDANIADINAQREQDQTRLEDERKEALTTIAERQNIAANEAQRKTNAAGSELLKAQDTLKKAIGVAREKQTGKKDNSTFSKLATAFAAVKAAIDGALAGISTGNSSKAETKVPAKQFVGTFGGGNLSEQFGNLFKTSESTNDKILAQALLQTELQQTIATRPSGGSNTFG